MDGVDEIDKHEGVGCGEAQEKDANVDVLPS